MTHSKVIDSFLSRSHRAALCAAIAAMSITACGGDNSKSAPAASGGSAISVDIAQFEREDDYAIGSKDANISIAEYASVVCGHCANWHSTVYPEFKKKYIDTGKVRYIFRGFPTAPQQLADAGHMIAMCAGEENYFKNIKLQFDRQKQIFEQAGQGKAREAYLSLAKASGLSEEDFIACIQDEDIREKYEATVQSGYDLGVSGTPSFFINGEKHQVYDLASIEEIILPMLGEKLPEKPEALPEDEKNAEESNAAEKNTEEKDAAMTSEDNSEKTDANPSETSDDAADQPLDDETADDETSDNTTSDDKTADDKGSKE